MIHFDWYADDTKLQNEEIEQSICLILLDHKWTVDGNLIQTKDILNKSSDC